MQQASHIVSPPNEPLDCLSGGGEMGALMRSIDWSRTPLGPVAKWSQALRTMVGLLLRNRFPLLLWWGPRFIQLYNDAYRPIPGAKHPMSMGQPASECWAEIWHVIGPMIEAPFRGEPATWSDDLELYINRRGFLEETHFKVAYSPVPDETVQPTGVGGVLATVSETTEQVYGERQLQTLRELGIRAVDAKTAEAACLHAASTFAASRDVPFALLYLLDAKGETAQLAGAHGFATDNELAAPSVIDLSSGPVDGGWPIDRVVSNREIELVGDLEARFPNLPQTERGVSPHTAILLPLASPDQPRVYGFLLAGTSPHRALDTGYRTFFELAAAQIVTAIRNARAYDDERKRADALAEIDRSKTIFFSNISHEFRTPLTLMLGPTEEALASPERALRGPDLETVHRNELRLLKLVNQLLDFSRIEAGRARVSYEATDLSSLTADLASSFRSAIERGGLVFDVDCPPLSAPVYVDREMWEKIVLNLLSNAFKFTLEGSIRVALTENADCARLTIADTGVGIDESELPRLFERFHRIEGTKSRSHEGSGIGLALVHDLVRLHGGRVEVESKLGRGTTFTILLPKQRPTAEWLTKSPAPQNRTDSSRKDAFVEEALRWLPDQPSGPRGGSVLDADPFTTGSPRARILVADDNADMRAYVTRLLSPHWRVEAVADGAAALAMARRDPPELVLADVMMPELDGFALIRELRADPRTKSVPIILLSARAGEEATADGLRAGADDYLVKPFSAASLLVRIESRLVATRARAAAELERKSLLTLFLSGPAAICILRGPDFTVEVANQRLLDVWGKTADIIGKPLLEVLPEIRDQVFPGLLRQVLATGKAYRANGALAKLDSNRDGNLKDVYFDFVYEPIREKNGEISGVLVFAVDVTEQIIARRSAEAALQAAETANRAKDEFLAVLGHELRNPLAPIMTALHLMRLRAPDAVERERTIIERQADHLVRLVDDLLDVSRITRGKVELKRTRLELAEVVAKAIEMTSPILEQRAHKLTVDVAQHGLAVDVDAARMAQVIANLLTNAAKYTERDGRIQVAACRSDTNDRVLLTVRDNGIGIAPQMLPRIFDMFVQERQALDRSQGGLGLGLTIVHSLLAIHGGTVSAHSDGVGRGAEFTVSLPAAPAIDVLPRGDQRPDVAPALPGPGGLRILIVDDNEDAAELLASALQAMGHDTRVAHDAPQALRVVANYIPDIALLDIGLPVMDGYELARRLRERPGFERLVLAAVTGYGQPADRDRSAEAGFTAHFVKPVSVNELQSALEGLRTTVCSHPIPGDGSVG